MVDSAALESPVKVGSSRAITRISVDKLFGQFTYQIPARGEPEADLSSLFILYGDNGSGKTTILRLLYHLLSPEDRKRHKTAVSKVRFRRFSVELADGTVVEALRPGKAQEGSYRAAILKGGETVAAAEFPSPSGRCERNDEESARVESFLRKLRDLRITLHFLSDDRGVQGRYLEADEIRRHRYRTPFMGALPGTEFIEAERSGILSPLKLAAARTAKWINQQAYNGAHAGQRNVHAIYTDITKHLVDLPATADRASDQQLLEAIVEKLETLSERSEA